VRRERKRRRRRKKMRRRLSTPRRLSRKVRYTPTCPRFELEFKLLAMSPDEAFQCRQYGH
jgi:hypothetical protein